MQADVTSNPASQSDKADANVLAEERQFDFWLGDWDLSWGDNKTGTNHVHTILDGRVIMENFDGQPSMPLKGISVSTYDANLRKWRQTWVDNQGSYIDLAGEYQGAQMLLTTEDLSVGKPQKLRMIFYNITPDTFDWNWESFDESSNSWMLRWKIHYQRRIK